MEIILIRHAKVNMKWERKYNSQGYDKACELYDFLPIIPVEARMDAQGFDVYTSELARAADTAKALFGDGKFKQIALLNEVPLASFTDTDKEKPTWLWNVMGRVQWHFNAKRQPESRKATVKRAFDTIAFLEKNTEKAYCVTHGFYMMTLLKAFKKRGYRVDKRRRGNFENMEMIRVTK